MPQKPLKEENIIVEVKDLTWKELDRMLGRYIDFLYGYLAYIIEKRMEDGKV